MAPAQVSVAGKGELPTLDISHQPSAGNCDNLFRVLSRYTHLPPESRLWSASLGGSVLTS